MYRCHHSAKKVAKRVSKASQLTKDAVKIFKQ